MIYASIESFWFETNLPFNAIRIYITFYELSARSHNDHRTSYCCCCCWRWWCWWCSGFRWSDNRCMCLLFFRVHCTSTTRIKHSHTAWFILVCSNVLQCCSHFGLFRPCYSLASTTCSMFMRCKAAICSFAEPSFCLGCNSIINSPDGSSAQM